MDIASTCPACGAQMTIPSDARQVHCHFCGMKYDVDLSGVEPVLKVATAPAEMPDVPEPEIPEPVIPPPVVEPVQPPPASPVFEPAHQTAKQPGGILSSPRIPESIRRQPIWAIIAVIVALLLCMAFACMAVAYGAIRLLTGM